MKYPSTSTFRFYNANPKNRIGGDCVIRAICTALNQSWEQTVREMTELGIKEGRVWDIWDSTDGCIGNYWIEA